MLPLLKISEPEASLFLLGAHSCASPASLWILTRTSPPRRAFLRAPCYHFSSPPSPKPPFLLLRTHSCALPAILRILTRTSPPRRALLRARATTSPALRARSSLSPARHRLLRLDCCSTDPSHNFPTSRSARSLARAVLPLLQLAKPEAGFPLVGTHSYASPATPRILTRTSPPPARRAPLRAPCYHFSSSPSPKPPFLRLSTHSCAAPATPRILTRTSVPPARRAPLRVPCYHFSSSPSPKPYFDLARRTLLRLACYSADPNQNFRTSRSALSCARRATTSSAIRARSFIFSSSAHAPAPRLLLHGS